MSEKIKKNEGDRFILGMEESYGYLSGLHARDKDADSSLLYIDHCREGRIESEIGNHAYSYLQEHEMRVDDRRSHSGRFCCSSIWFIIVSIMGMTSRLSSNVTQSLLPLC